MSRIIESSPEGNRLTSLFYSMEDGTTSSNNNESHRSNSPLSRCLNGRDADALVAPFGKDGTFCNPDTYPGVSGESLAAYVTALWTAFPDFQIELLNAGEIEPGLVAHHWRVRALIQARERMVASLLAEASQSRELPSFRLRERRLSRTSAILTGGL